MYAGILEHKQEFTFTHINSKVPFPPSSIDNGAFVWDWKELFDTGIDLSTELLSEAFIGAISFYADGTSFTEVQVLVDGEAAGIRTASKSDLLTGEVTVPVGVYGQRITLRLKTDFEAIRISDFTVLGAILDERPVIWPTPKFISEKGETRRIREIVSFTDDGDECYAAQFLIEGLSEKLGEWQDTDGVRVVFKKEEYDAERYTVKYEDGTVTVSASKRISLLYGASAVLSLSDCEGLFLADIDDAPSVPLRGFHFGLPHRDRMDFTRRLLRYVLLPMRYNTVFLEFAGGMRFDRHPEIGEAWLEAAKNALLGKQPFMPHSDKVSRYSLLEKDEIRAFASYIKELGFALIPEVQSLAHVQYITYAHPDLAELDERVVEVDVRSGADARPESFYAHSYCPSNKKSYEIIFDIIDEIVEVTNPDGYVHIGHDEVYQIGLCERCRKRAPHDLFADHVTALYGYLQKKGLKTMMWADMLQPPTVTEYLTHKAIERLPKDIIMLDFIWYFHTGEDIEDNLLSHGFKVAVGNLYSSHYPRFRNRIKKAGMIGGEVSTWLISDEEMLARNGKLWDITYLSEMLWNADGYDERNRRTYNEIISTLVQPEARDRVRGICTYKGFTEDELEFFGENEEVPEDILELCPSAVISDSLDLKADECFDRLIFEHATVNAAAFKTYKECQHIGSYKITYEDTETELVDISYGKNALCFKSGYAIPKHQEYYRHFGYLGTWLVDPAIQAKNERGEDLLILGFVWENPHPEKRITNISYQSLDGDYAILVTAGVKGVSFNK